MNVRSVLLLAILFWGTGALVCLGLSLKGLWVTSDEPRFAGLNEKYHWARWGSFDAGLLLGLLQAGLLFVPLARREAVRIVSLDKPRCIDFFPPRHLALVICVAITCAAARAAVPARRVPLRSACAAPGRLMWREGTSLRPQSSHSRPAWGARWDGLGDWEEVVPHMLGPPPMPIQCTTVHGPRSLATSPASAPAQPHALRPPPPAHRHSSQTSAP